MEYNDKIKKERIQLAMVLGLWVAIVLLLIAIIVVVKNVNEIKSNPIVYGIDKYDLEVCSCYDSKGNSVDFDKNGVIEKDKWNINFGD